MSAKEQAHHNNHPISKEQHPAPEQTESAAPLLHPSVLQRASQRPHAARPEALLQLQRLQGNRAVGQMIAMRAAGRASAPVARPQPALTQAEQKVNTPEQQDAPAADQIASAVMALPDAPPADTPTPLATAMQRAAITGDAEPGRADQAAGSFAVGYNSAPRLNSIQRQTERELKSDKYMKKMEEYKKSFPSGAEGGPAIMGAEDEKSAFGEMLSNPDMEAFNKLTPAERAAIRTYTTDRYKLINPAMAGNAEWFNASLSSKTVASKQHIFAAEQGLDAEKVMKANKKIGKMALSGMNNLPDWEHTQPLFRGETLAQEEAENLKAGGTKHYPSFVSASRNKMISQMFLRSLNKPENKNEKRPVLVLWQIVKSKHGKDIKALSVSQGESEILFLPNTTFKIASDPTDAKLPYAGSAPYKIVNLEEVASDKGQIKSKNPPVDGGKSAGAQPAGAQPVETESASAQPADAQPVATESASAQPADAQPVETEPASAQPAGAQPVETEPAGAQPTARGLKSDKYMKKMQEYKKTFPSGAAEGPAIMGAEDEESAFGHMKSDPDMEAFNKLTPAERAAIRTYTTDRYKLINPAMAGNAEWFKASLLSKTVASKQDIFAAEQGLDTEKVMKANKKIGKMAQSGMSNLPDWEHTQPLFRGETLSEEEVNNLKAGGTKHYPSFVSASRNKMISQMFLRSLNKPENKNEKRPVLVLWQIVKSKHGKDIKALSVSQGESEILFLPNTTFKIASDPTDAKLPYAGSAPYKIVNLEESE